MAEITRVRRNVIRVRGTENSSRRLPELTESLKTESLKQERASCSEVMLYRMRRQLASFYESRNAQMAVNCRPGRSRR